MSYTTSTVVSFGDPDAQPGASPLGILLVFSAAIAVPGAWRTEETSGDWRWWESVSRDWWEPRGAVWYYKRLRYLFL